MQEDDKEPKDLFERYQELKEKTAHYNPQDILRNPKNMPEEYRQLLQVESEINNLILTGYEVIDLLEKYNIQNNEDTIQARNSIILKKNLSTLLEGKQGSFVDAIKTLLDQD
jgi:hypothetical protein